MVTMRTCSTSPAPRPTTICPTGFRFLRGSLVRESFTGRPLDHVMFGRASWAWAMQRTKHACRLRDIVATEDSTGCIRGAPVSPTACAAVSLSWEAHRGGCYSPQTCRRRQERYGAAGTSQSYTHSRILLVEFIGWLAAGVWLAACLPASAACCWARGRLAWLAGCS